MKRHQLEHVLRAASRIVEQRDFLVIGSAAVPDHHRGSVGPAKLRLRRVSVAESVGYLTA